MQASSTMTRDVVCAGPDDSLTDAYEMMTEWEVRHLPVLKGNLVVGILSDRDILLHAVLDPDKGLLVENISVAAAMTESPITCRVTADLGRVAATMIAHKIDCLPVVDEGGGLVGLVTSADLLQILVDKTGASSLEPLPFQWQIYTNVRPGVASARGGTKLNCLQ